MLRLEFGCGVALQRAQRAVPLRSIGEMGMKNRAEGTAGRRARLEGQKSFYYERSTEAR